MSGEADNAALYNDLLQRAGGDRQLVSLWLAEMGYDPAPFQQQQAADSTIKAVGTREHALGSWASTCAQSKTKLCGTEDSEAGLESKESKEELDLDAEEAAAPRHFFCPISMHVMRDPVMLPTGQSYERHCIERWLANGNCTCPATGQQLAAPATLTPNVSLRNAIEEWAEKYAPRLLDPVSRRLKPIPKEDSFALPSPTGAGTGMTGCAAPNATASDRELAARMQREELERIAALRAAASGGSAARRSGSGRSGSARSRRAASGVAEGASEEPSQQQAGWWTLTTLLLLLASAAYCTTYVLTIWKNGWAIESLQLNPLVGGSQSALLRLGAQSADALVVSHQWWRLATSPFISAGVIQVVGNLISLFSFGKYLERALPRPWLSLPAVFLLSGTLGALCSANLNAYYVTCGASAGVCGLLGGVWADQMLNWRRYTSRFATLLSLAFTTVVFVAVSLLPLLDPWYTVAAMLAGFLSTTILLLVAKVGRGQPRSGRYVLGQMLCAFLLIAGATVGIVGLVLDSKVGQDCGFCKSVSCLDVSWWECVETWSTTTGCQLTVLANGTQALECSANDYVSLSEMGLTSVSPGTDIDALCDQYCVAGGSTPPSNGGSGGGGVGGSGGGSSNTGGSSGGGSSDGIIK